MSARDDVLRAQSGEWVAREQAEAVLDTDKQAATS
jgi:hypothetical protein